MRTYTIEVRRIRLEDAGELLLVQNEQVIETLLAYAPKASARSKSWREERRTAFAGSCSLFRSPPFRRVDQSRGRACAFRTYVLLDGAFGNPDAQLEVVAADAFSAPQAIVAGHDFDQLDGLGRDFGLPGSSFGALMSKVLRSVQRAIARLFLN